MKFLQLFAVSLVGQSGRERIQDYLCTRLRPVSKERVVADTQLWLAGPVLDWMADNGSLNREYRISSANTRVERRYSVRRWTV